MLWFLLFFIELLGLFLLSRIVTRLLSHFFYKLTKSKSLTVSIIAFFFLPGTIIHELAHAISAGLLGVYVGKMEFVPKVTEDTIKLGSVQIAQTDPIRRFLIGAAPFFAGTTIMLGLLFYAGQNHLFDNALLVIVITFAVFEIGNTMFSSKKDMEGALELLGTIVLLIIIFYLLGVRLPSFNPDTILSHPLVIEVFKNGSLFLLFPLSLDALIVLFLRPTQRHKM